jgi:putative DNA primase/helicase
MKEQWGSNSPFASGARTYRRQGWPGTIPVPADDKWPPPAGFTGRNGRWPTDVDVQGWSTEVHNIALRLPPTVIGLDVDAYATDKMVKTGDKTLAALIEQLGPLPRTWRSTSRDSYATGISFYRVPAGVQLPGDAGAFIEVVQYHHRYAVVWPSVVKGREYRWYRPDGSLAAEGEVPTPDEFPELPATWVAWLDKLAKASAPSSTKKPREQMVEGDRRNDRLASLAGSARRNDSSPEALLAFVKAENAGFREPLSDKEVERIAKSIGGYDSAARTFNRTDAGNAELFASLYGDRLRYDHRRSRWLLWDDVRWQPDADGQVHRLALDAARHRFHAAASITDAKAKEAEASWAIRSEAKQRLDAMLAVATSCKPIADAGDGWDADPMLLGVPNGVVDLRSGQLRAGRQDDRITMQAGVAYDPSAKAPRWERHLLEVSGGDTALAAFHHRALGYSLTGDTSEECFFFAYGDGRNGKTKTYQAVRAVMGDYGMTAPFTMLTPNRYGGSGPTPELARLDGARFVSASETTGGMVFDEAKMKQLTGGDTIAARHLHSPFFEFLPRLKLWLSANDRPGVHDMSAAFWSRVRLLPFTVNFEERGTMDRRLASKLKGELPGILAWMVEGCLAWQRDGLIAPAAVTEAVEEYRDASDPVIDFVGERCVRVPGAWVSHSEVYTAYSDWMDSQGRRTEKIKTRKFGSDFERHFPRGREGGKGTKGFTGLSLTRPEYAFIGGFEGVRPGAN